MIHQIADAAKAAQDHSAETLSVKTRLIVDPMMHLIRPLQFRGKGRLLNFVVPRSGVRVCEVFGYCFSLDLADYIQRQIYLGTFEPHETKLIRSRLRPGMTFVDVGANVGYFTALAASLVGREGRVIAFEPSPYAFDKLRTMVEVNQLKHVTAVNAGLSDRTDTLKLFLGVGSDNHTPTMIPHENSTATEVSVRTLDSTMEELGVYHIDVMKIDVEGYEPKVLQGARRLLRERRIHGLLCEFNQHWLNKAGWSPETLEALITGGGLVEANHRSGHRELENRFFFVPHLTSSTHPGADGSEQRSA